MTLTPQLFAACRDVVAYKAIIDRAVHYRSQLSGVLPRAKRVSVCPLVYAKCVFPFYNVDNQSDEGIHAVPSDAVIGSTYKHFEPTTRAKLELLNATSPCGLSRAWYYQIGTLPIYFAYEGKNRVQAYQSHNLEITCDLWASSYPSVESLSIHAVKGCPGHYVLHCRDEFFVGSELSVAPLCFPNVSIPVLRAYGVKMGEDYNQIVDRSDITKPKTPSQATYWLLNYLNS
ncbi:hypothetical protein AB6D11_00020 [Vibrio splendidus]